MTSFPGLRQPEMRLNIGSPMSRTRVMTVRSSLFGLSNDPVKCTRGEVLALYFGDAEPVAMMYRILESIGLDDPEQLRLGFGSGLSRKVCAPNAHLEGLDAASADAFAVLRTGFLLGLCTGVLFDPGRPVLWTQASLTRRLELFDMGGFYL